MALVYLLTRLSTYAKEVLNRVWPCLSKSFTTMFFSIRSRTAWHVHIQASLKLLQIPVSVNCRLSIKATGKTAVGETRSLVKSFPWTFGSGSYMPLVVMWCTRICCVSSRFLPFAPCYSIVLRRTIGQVFPLISTHTCRFLQH